MITIDSKINKQIAKNLSLEGMLHENSKYKFFMQLIMRKKLQMNLFVKSLLNNEIYSNFSKGIKLS
ncbi:hypothetical protein [Staphylococcus aureus]|uniref:hypothetical protein n=1 Tax=Staphylococcus aureus TaxID=1280 RepID=UPI001B342160|nr:hypothetical protein [Staphylococcus aureus]